MSPIWRSSALRAAADVTASYDPCYCHRALLLEAMGEGAEVVDLFA